MTIGFDIGVAAKTLAPLLSGLAKAASDPTQKAIAKWKASDFPTKLATKLSAADRVKTIWSRDRFVSLTGCYHPSSIDRNNKRVTINSICELPRQNIVIEGIVGQGKSMFLQFLYLQELSGNGSGGLPLFILLRTITEKRSFADHLKESLANLEIEPTDEVFDYLAKSGHLILLLDGFDELDSNLVKDTIASIESLVFKYPTLRVIITSRPNSDIQKSRHLEVVQLSDLPVAEYDAFLKKLAVDTIRRDEIITAINESPADVVELISTPLMLTLVAHVYAAEKEIPSELPLFFEKLFVTTFVGHDRQKGGGFRREHHTGLSERKIQLLFEAFCFLTLQRQIGRTLNGDEFASVFESAQELIEDANCTVEQFKLDITKVACLMLEDGFDQTSFLHMSIAEYFTAAFIKRANENFATRFYRYAIDNYHHLLVTLAFLEKIDSYRFNKYYVAPPLESFLKLLESGSDLDTTDSKWLDAIKAIFPTIKISFARTASDAEFKFTRLTLQGTAHSKFGELSFETLHDALMKVINEERLTSSIIDENMKYFAREEHPGYTEFYTMNFEGAIKVWGENVFLQQFRRIEHSLKTRLIQAQSLIENEDSKASKVFW